MQTRSPQEITRLLVAWGEGDQSALEDSVAPGGERGGRERAERGEREAQKRVRKNIPTPRREH
jgi:hypothetical protein